MQKFIEAFQIFAKYYNNPDKAGIGAGHDIIYLWPDQEINDSDQARLEELGWGYNPELPAWYYAC